MPSIDPEVIHTHRVRRLHLLISAMLIALGGFWCLYFINQGLWWLALADVAIIGFGVAGLVLTRRGQARIASYLLLAASYVVLCCICLFLDIPSSQAPRATHHFLFALAIGSYLMLRSEPLWLRQGVPLLFFATYLVFASTLTGIATPYALPDNVRTVGTWINNSSALLGIFWALHIMQTDIEVRTTMESDLWLGLSHNQFLLHYQPQVATGGHIVGAEALVRWRHPVHGMVSPGEFIPMAERTGMILPLGQWVLETGCAQLVAWSAKPETATLTLAVNVSVPQFRQAEFVEQVLSAVQRSGADPSKLKLELTESLFASDLNDIIQKMTALKAHGIGFSLDDFGTGYSSLSYLKKLPLDQLKIDQAFVTDVLSNPHDAAIAQTVIDLGKNLGLAVIAEGVETEGQREFLAARGCHAFQGYLCSRPLPAEEFDAFVCAASRVTA